MQKERVFIAWSGSYSREIAELMYGWLPNVLPFISPFVATESVKVGGRWFSELSVALETTKYAIVCITAENMESRWLHFEAGACAHAMNGAHVCPLLIDVDSADLKDPLAQFLGCACSREGVNRLTKAINACLGEPENESLRQGRFEMSWPSAERLISLIRERHGGTDDRSARRDPEQLLREAVELLRDQRRLIANPSSLLPSSYLVSAILDAFDTRPGGEARALRRLAELVGSRNAIRGERSSIPIPDAPELPQASQET